MTTTEHSRTHVHQITNRCEHCRAPDKESLTSLVNAFTAYGWHEHREVSQKIYISRFVVFLSFTVGVLINTLILLLTDNLTSSAWLVISAVGLALTAYEYRSYRRYRHVSPPEVVELTSSLDDPREA